jgi:hypothetical protein
MTLADEWRVSVAPHDACLSAFPPTIHAPKAVFHRRLPAGKCVLHDAFVWLPICKDLPDDDDIFLDADVDDTSGTPSARMSRARTRPGAPPKMAHAYRNSTRPQRYMDVLLAPGESMQHKVGRRDATPDLLLKHPMKIAATYI